MSEAASLILAFIFWIGLSIVVGEYAHKRGRSSTAWFLVGLLFSPFLALILVAVLEPGTQGTLYRDCPFCAERVKSAAIVCRFCGRDLPTDLLAELVS